MCGSSDGAHWSRAAGMHRGRARALAHDPLRMALGEHEGADLQRVAWAHRRRCRRLGGRAAWHALACGRYNRGGEARTRRNAGTQGQAIDIQGVHRQA